jgi:predicted phage terminase large subunit-like protein
MSGTSPSPTFGGLFNDDNFRYLQRSLYQDSLFEYLKAVWPVIEPGRPFYPGWHIQAVCFPADTLVTTREGDMQIGDIVNLGYSGDVLSWNHERSESEWKPIVSRMKNPGKKLFKLVTASGTVIRATPEHPVYIKGRGYVRIDMVRPGERLRTVRQDVSAQVQQHEATFLRSSMFCKTQSCQKAKVRMRQEATRRMQTLQSMLCQDAAKGVLSSVLPLLHGGLQKPGAIGSDFTNEWRLLFSKMFRSVLPWREQRSLHDGLKQAKTNTVSTGIQQDSPIGDRARSVSLPALFQAASVHWQSHEEIDDRSSSYRLGHLQQRDGEPGQSLPSMPQSTEGNSGTSREMEEDLVVACFATDERPRHVYNIEVEGNNNYFANGIHVHNCEHLEAVESLQIRRLLINIPPRSTKSTLLSVVFPTWCWARRPENRFLMTTYSQSLLERDAIKARDIIWSDWYRSLWGDKVQIRDDQSANKFYKNTAGGYRISTTPGGAGTGFGGDFVIGDDLHNIKEKEHPNQIKQRVEWWRDSMSTRFEDATTAAWIVCGQRVCLGDVSDYCIEAGYEHLMIPMEFDAENGMYDRSPKCMVTAIGWTDPRHPGQPLEGQVNVCPERFPDHVLNSMKLALRINASAQLQQDPKPGEGGIFDVTTLSDRIVPATPRIGRRVRYWDRAFSEDGGAYTVGLLMCMTNDGLIYVEDVQRKQMSPARRNAFIKLIAQRDAHLSNNSVQIYIEQEPAAGKESARILAQQLAGFPVFLDPARRGKEARAIPVASQMAAGNVYLREAAWNTAFTEELEYFPNSTYKDQVDAFSGAFNKLALGESMSITGNMLFSGDVNDNVQLNNREVANLGQEFPELADIVAGINESAGFINHFDQDTNPIGAAFTRQENIIDAIAEATNEFNQGHSLQEIETNIADLLLGMDIVEDGEYSNEPAFIGADDECEAWEP